MANFIAIGIFSGLIYSLVALGYTLVYLGAIVLVPMAGLVLRVMKVSRASNGSRAFGSPPMREDRPAARTTARTMPRW